MAKILNQEITVLAYKIEPSKYPEKGNGMRLIIQFRLKDETNVVFTSGIALQEMISKVPKSSFPFKTTIKEQNERFEFT